MPAPDYIVRHEDWQPESLVEFIARRYMNHGFGRLPPIDADHIQGTVRARISAGRWIADCSCNSAMIVSTETPYFICPECGNAHNDGRWRRVIFPSNRAAIETVLLKRPLMSQRRTAAGELVWMQGRNPMEAWNRNWSPGETLTTLRRENIEHGLEP